MKRIEELTFKFVDGEITDNEALELDELTQSSDGRDWFLGLMEVESHLLSAGRNNCDTAPRCRLAHSQAGKARRRSGPEWTRRLSDPSHDDRT